jgi:hypothetical protein
MLEDMNDAKTNAPEAEVNKEENRDTISKLLHDRDRGNRNRPDYDPSQKKGNLDRTPERARGETPALENPSHPRSTPAKLAPAKAGGEEGKADPSSREGNPKDSDGIKDGDQSSAPPSTRETSSAGASLSELEALRVKLEKTEKVLAENQRYGRTNAQKVKNAQKVVQKFADEGLLTDEEARELFGVLQADGREPPLSGGEREDADMPHSAAHHSPASLFAPIFKVANQELENIRKYTDDDRLQDKVNAFDYFLSVGSKEEVGHVLAELTGLLDDPVKLAKKMLSIGQTVFEESYKHIQEAGGFKNYLSKKDEALEKLQKKIDKLEEKLLQYEDFDQPRYRIDEMGDGDDRKPAVDTISNLFEARDGRSAGRPLSRFGG